MSAVEASDESVNAAIAFLPSQTKGAAAARATRAPARSTSQTQTGERDRGEARHQDRVGRRPEVLVDRKKPPRTRPIAVAAAPAAQSSAELARHRAPGRAGARPRARPSSVVAIAGSVESSPSGSNAGVPRVRPEDGAVEPRGEVAFRVERAGGEERAVREQEPGRRPGRRRGRPPRGRSAPATRTQSPMRWRTPGMR